MSTEDTTDDESRHPYETDESFHPMGKEWEDRMREELEDTDYDADLGMKMARDAQRLVAGEISETEFYATYHDDVEEEFEADDRPVLEEFDDETLENADLDELEEAERSGSMLESVRDIDIASGDVSRRELMKQMGAGGALLAYGAFATREEEPRDEIPQLVEGINHPDPEDMEHRWGMVIDLERCDGCLACVAGCIDENGTSTGANWMYVFTYEDERSDQENFLVRPCQHCSNAPCAKVCPVRARHTRDKDGIVLTNYETCIGCRYCQVACPYGVNYFQWGEPDVPMNEIEHLGMRPEEVRELDFEERQERLTEAHDHVYDERGWWTDSRPPMGTMGKCTFCPSRQDGHEERPEGTVACMDACQTAGMSAIHFGDMADEESRPRRYMRRRAEQEFDQDTQFEDPQEEYEETVTPWGKLSTFKLLQQMGTQPNITYIGNEPGENAKQIDGPVSYSALRNRWGVEVVDERKEHLDYGARGPPEEEEEEA